MYSGYVHGSGAYPDNIQVVQCDRKQKIYHDMMTLYTTFGYIIFQ